MNLIKYDLCISKYFCAQNSSILQEFLEEDLTLQLDFY